MKSAQGPAGAKQRVRRRCARLAQTGMNAAGDLWCEQLILEEAIPAPAFVFDIS
jgi:hypothetical protein